MKRRNILFRSGKLTDNHRFCFFMLSVGRKEGLGVGGKCPKGLFSSYHSSFISVNKVFFTYFKVLRLFCP